MSIDPDVQTALDAQKTEIVGHLGEINVALNGLSDRVTALEDGGIGLPVEPVVPPHLEPDPRPTVPATPATHPTEADVGASGEGEDHGYLKVRGDISGGRASFCRVYTSGVTIEDVEFVANADNNSFLVTVQPGVEDVTFRRCSFDISKSPDINAAIYGGRRIRMIECRVWGTGDGVKIMDDSEYLGNWVHVYKPSGSEKHTDCMQASGTTNWKVKGNTLIARAEDGGNSCVFAQVSDGRHPHEMHDCEVVDNYLNGGNLSIYAIEAHNGKPDEQAAMEASDALLIARNTFGRDFRYGPWRGKARGDGNVFEDGEAIPV